MIPQLVRERKPREGMQELGASSRRCHDEGKCPESQGYKCPELQGYKCPELQGYRRSFSTAQHRDSSPSVRYGSPVAAPQVFFDGLTARASKNAEKVIVTQ